MLWLKRKGGYTPAPVKRENSMNRVLSWLLTVTLLVLAFPLMARAASDIEGHPAQEVIESWIELGYISGYPDGTFRPDQTVTRVEFMTLLNRVCGFNHNAAADFTDVHPDDWFYDIVSVGVAAGYISGYPDGSFRPKAIVTRAEAASMVARAIELETFEEHGNRFIDIPDGYWNARVIDAITEAGIMRGFEDGTFRPDAEVSRADAVTILNHILPQGSENEVPEVVPTSKNEEANEVLLEITGGGSGSGSSRGSESSGSGSTDNTAKKDVTFNIYHNGTNNLFLATVQVTFNGETKNTTDGTVTFANIPYGAYSVTAKATGYKDYTTQIVVNTNTVTQRLEMDMNASTANVTFNIYHSNTMNLFTSPTTVIFNSQTKTTTNGTVTFDDVPYGTRTVTAKTTTYMGYKDYSKSVTVGTNIPVQRIDMKALENIAFKVEVHNSSGLIATDGSFTVTLTNKNDATKTYTMNTIAGIASFTSVLEGAYTVSIAAQNGYKTYSKTDVTVSSNGSHKAVLEADTLITHTYTIKVIDEAGGKTTNTPLKLNINGTVYDSNTNSEFIVTIPDSSAAGYPYTLSEVHAGYYQIDSTNPPTLILQGGVNPAPLKVNRLFNITVEVTGNNIAARTLTTKVSNGIITAEGPVSNTGTVQFIGADYGIVAGSYTLEIIDKEPTALNQEIVYTGSISIPNSDGSVNYSALIANRTLP